MNCSDKDQPEDGIISAMLLNQNTVCTIDFIATNSTSLPKQWVASISWSTSEIKIDNVLSKYFQSRRIQVLNPKHH